MLADIMLIGVALVALVFASVSDLRIKEVPDWLSYGLMASALGIRLIYSLLSSNWMYFLYGAIGLGSMTAVGMLFYYSKQWGGGDAKLLMGLGAVFATRPFYMAGQWPMLADIMMNLLVVGALYGVAWSFFLFLRKRKAVLKEAKALLVHRRRMRLFYSLGCLALLFPIVILFEDMQRIVLLSALALFFLGFYLFVLVKAVEKVGMYRYLPPVKLVEGDWIAEDVKVGGEVICGPGDLGITREQIALLRSSL